MGTFHVIAKETKEQILNRIKNEGVSVPQAAKDAGISNTTIYTWLGRTTQGQHNTTEVLRLQRELQGTYELIGKLTIELLGLKKRTVIGNSFMQTDAVKTKKITKTEMARKLGISRGMLYYQHKRPLIDEEIKHQIEAVLAEHKAYGHKRIAPELKLNKKRVLRVMKKFNIKPYRMRPRKPNKKEDEGKAAEKDTINV